MLCFSCNSRFVLSIKLFLLTVFLYFFLSSFVVFLLFAIFLVLPLGRMVDEKNDAVFRTANAADRAILKAPDGEMVTAITTYLHLSADCILVHLMRTARIAWTLFLAYV